MKKHLQRLLLLMALLVVPWVTQGQTTLTVNDGTERNQYIPLYGYYVDMGSSYKTTQFIIPREQLTSLIGQSITDLRFYANYSQNFGVANWNIYIGETSQTTMSSIANFSDCELVYSGNLAIVSNELAIPLDDEYAYGGGNLLVLFDKASIGTCSPSGSEFYGISASSGASGYSSSGFYTSQSFLPKLTITYTAGPTCPKPSGLIFSDITTNGATVSWTAANSAQNNFVVAYGTGTDPDVMSTINASATNATIPNLNSNTKYNVFVKADCGGGDVSAWSSMASFRTLFSCGDDYALREPVLGTGTSTGYTTPFYAYSSYSRGKSWNIYKVSELADQDVYPGYIHGLSLQYAGSSDATFPVNIYIGETDKNTFSGSSDTIAYSAMTLVYSGNVTFEAGSDWTPIYFDTPAQYTGEHNVVVLFERTGSVSSSLYFKYTSSSNASLYGYLNYSSWSRYATSYRPNVKFTMCVDEPSCLSPQNFAVVNAATNSVDLTWIPRSAANPDGWQFEKTAGGVTSYAFIPFSAVTVTDGMVYGTLTGLDENTEYSLRLREVCVTGEDTSDWCTTSVSFRTDCAAKSLPYACGFETEDGVPSTAGYRLPYCWYRTATSSHVSDPYVIGSNAHSGSNSIIVDSKEVWRKIVVLPLIDVAAYPMTGNRLDFWAKSSADSDSGYTLVIGTMTDPDDWETFVADSSLYLTNVYTEYKIRFKSTGAYPAIMLESDIDVTTPYRSIYIDDILLRVNPTCETPNDFVKGVVNSGSVALSWTDSDASAWSIEVNNTTDDIVYNVDVTSVTRGVVNTDSVGHLLTGLQPLKNYELRLRSVCGVGDTSYWSINTPSFTTLDNATDITAFNITTADVQLGDAVIDADNHTIQVTYAYGYDITSLNASFTIPSGATADINGAVVSSLSGVDFSAPVALRVTAVDTNVHQVWTITLVQEACARPLAVAATDVQKYQLNIVVTPNPYVANGIYQMVYDTVSLDATALEAATPISMTGTEQVIDNLLRNTTYYIYVRNVCGTEVSEWVSTSAKTKTNIDCDKTDEVIVADGTTTNEYVPVYGYYCDNAQRVQSIYPASMLTDLVGKTIKGLKYDVSQGDNVDKWNSCDFDVKLAVTDLDDLSAGLATDAMTTVYTGTLTANTTDDMVVNFDTQFEYTGGNLLVEFQLPSAAGYAHVYFNGVPSTNASRYNYSSTNKIQDFLPKVVFSVCGVKEACPAVATVSISDIETNSAKVTWTASEGDFANTYDICYATAPITDFSGVTPQITGATGTYSTISGLTAYTDYYVYVRCKCDAGGYDDGYSPWAAADVFKTLSLCNVVTNLTVEPASKTTATATWTGTTQANNFQYVLSTTELTDAELETTSPVATGLTEATATLTGLVPEQIYYLYVANNCTGEGLSPYVGTSFTMPEACVEPTNLAIANLDKYSFTATWSADTYADATDTYDMIVSDTELDDATLASATITYAGIADTSKIVELLQRGTTYYVYVRGNCGATNGNSDWVSVSITTLDIEPDCDNTVEVQIGEGTTSAYLIYTSYGNTYSQHIYTAEELRTLGYEAGTINSVSFWFTSTSSYAKDQSVYIGATELSAFAGSGASNFISGLTRVYGPTNNTLSSSGWRTYTFDQPFEWDGVSNIVVGMLSNKQGASSSSGWSVAGTAGSAYRTIYRYRDTSPIDIDNLSAVSYGSNSTTRPNIKFAFCAPAEACPTVDAPVVSNVEVTIATLTWNKGEGDFASSYDVVVSDEEITDFSTVVPTATNLTDTTYNATGLTGNTTYYAYVRVNCVNENYNDGSSTWSPAGTFITELPCRRPTDFADTRIYAHAVDLTWVNVNNATAWQVGVVGAADTTWQDVVNPTISNDTVSYQFTGLTASSAYHFLLRANCSASGDGFSGICFDEVNIATISDANDITAFSVSSNYPDGFQMEDATIDAVNHTIEVTVLSGTDLTALNPRFRTNSYASDPFKINGAFYNKGAIDFSNPVVVTVYAEDTTLTQDWTITVNYEACATPASLTINNVERRKMTLNWTLGDTSATNFDLVVSETEITDLTTATPQSITVDGDSNSYSYTVEGLTRNTQYYIYLRTNCGTEQSHWASAARKTPDICNELQVIAANGSMTNNILPIYGYYCDDANVKSQSIYPESMLTELVGMPISSMKYFVSSGSSASYYGSWENVDFTVKMGTTTATSLASGYVSDATQTVYVGHVSANTTNGMVIDFDTPFLYTGGNLVIEFSKTVASGYSSCYFFGSQVYNSSYNTNSSNDSEGVKSFLPKVQFYASACDEACPAVDTAYAELTGEGINTATVHWTESKGDYANTYDVIVSETEITDFTGLTPNYAAVNGLSQELSGLDAYTIYYVYVRANCDGEGQDDGSSTWYGFNFRTNAACHVPHDLAAELTNTNSVSITWTSDQDNNFRYILSTTPMALENLEATAKTGENLNATSLVVDNLDYETEYHFYLSNACGGSDGNSPWDSVSFSTLPQCTAVVDLMASDTAANSVRLTWTNGQFCNATSWQVTAIDATDNVVYDRVATDTTTLVFGLAPETAYTLAVRAICGTDDTAAATTATITTMPAPADCLTVFDGSATNSNVPVYGLYADAYLKCQMVYPATQMQDINGGQITGMTYYLQTPASASWGVANFKVYVMDVPYTSISAYEDVESNATLVYEGSLDGTNPTMTVNFTTPYTYNGGNLLVAVYNTNIGTYKSCTFVGSTVNDASIEGYSYTSMGAIPVNHYNFLPKTSFCTAPIPCRSVSNMVAENVTVNSADISWTPGGSETSWNVYNSATELDADALAALTATDYTTVDYPAQALSALNTDADYYYYVQANCSATETSDWKVLHFVTLPSCSAPLTAVASNDALDTLTFVVSAGVYGTAESYNYEYWTVGAAENGDTVAFTGTDSVAVAVAPFQTYGWRVQANCGTTDGLSRWTNGNEVYVCGVFHVDDSTSFTEGFEAPAFVSSCWTNQHVAGPGSSIWVRSTNDKHSGVASAQLPDMNATTYTDLATPILNVPVANDYEVSFWMYRIAGTSKQNEGVKVWVNTTPDTINGTPLMHIRRYAGVGEITETTSGWYQYRAPIPMEGNLYVIFQGISEFGNASFIDDISVNKRAAYSVSSEPVVVAEGSVLIAGDTNTEGKYFAFDTVTLTATAVDHYHFHHWTTGDDTISMVNPLSFVPTRDTILNAVFAIDTFAVALAVNDTTLGTVDGDSVYTYGSTATLTAEAIDHYHFRDWTDTSANVISTDNPASITVERDTMLIANFAIDTHQLALSVMPVDVMGAVADVNGYYNYGDSVNISATANYGYFFTGWSDNVTANERRIAILSDTAIAAQFDSLSYTITAQTTDAVMGAVTGTATQKYLTTVTLEATPEYGYHFVAWNDGNTDNPRTVTVERDSLFTASFDSNIYTVTVLADLDEEMQPKGDVTGSGEYKYLSQVDISVEQRLGFYFLNWSDGDIRANRTITVTSDTTITAMFSIQPVWAVATSCDTVMGTVTPRQNILDSLNATIEATDNYGYHFVSWNDGVTDNPRTLQVVSDTAFTAVFDYNQYTIGVATANSVMGSVTGTATKNYLQLDTIEATANYGYHFTAWNDGNTDNPRIVTVLRDSLFTASFDNNTYTVTVQHDTVMGTIENVGEYLYLDNVTLTAVPNVGYHLDHWDNGSEDATRSFVITCDTTFVFTFAPNVYALTVAADNDVKGTVSGNGNYNYNTNVSIAAVANYGYEFNSWNDGNTENPREVNIVTDSSFTALFDTVDFTITALAEVSTMGTVAGSGDYAYNTTATLTATPNYGYSFTQWSDGNTDNPRNVNVVANATYTAEFATNNYTITVNGDAVMGSAAGTGNYAYNTNAQISATANYGYHFTQWNDGNTDNPRTVVVTENVTYTAQFAANSYNVAVASENSLMGAVAGAGSYTYNTNATLTATANYGYSFAQWSDGNTSNPRTVTVTRDSIFTAQFAANNYNVTVVSANATMGSVAGSDSYTYNTNAQISATANYGYHFTQWNDGNTDNPRTVVVTENVTYTAQFAANTYQVTALSANNIMGTVSGTNEYTYNTNATLTATANYGYHFTQWNDGNTSNPRTVVVTENATYTAEFAANTYTLTVNGDAVMGSATGSGSYSYGETVMISATANYGYHFTQWNDGNVDNPRTVLVNDNITLTAQFANNGYEVTTAVTSEAGSGSITGAGFYEYGETATLTATATPCYHFVAWNDGVTEPVRTETVTSDLNFTAEFALNVYSSSFSEVACDSYEWAGITYTESVVEERVFQTANGCDSTVTMTLTVNYSDHVTLDLVESGSYTWNDVTYDQSGVYVQNFTNATNCDSIVTINLTIYGIAAPEIVDFAGVSLMVNHYPNGSTEYVDYADYRWYRDGQLVASGSDTYMEGNGKLNGCYYVEIPTDASKTVWDRSNELCFRNGVLVGIDEAEGLEVSLTVAPNPVRSGAMITVTTDLPAERLHGAILVIYDLNGREVNRVSMEQQSVRFNAEQTSGTYTVVLTTEDGVRIVKRVVVR